MFTGVRRASSVGGSLAWSGVVDSHVHAASCGSHAPIKHYLTYLPQKIPAMPTPVPAAPPISHAFSSAAIFSVLDWRTLRLLLLPPT